MTKINKAFDIDCSRSICVGDVIQFNEAVFSGSYRNASYAGERTIQATVLKDSYGEKTQQHTFTLEVITATGTDAGDIIPGSKIRRKGRNIYGPETKRQRWDDEEARANALAEKRQRGDAARARRDAERWGK